VHDAARVQDPLRERGGAADDLVAQGQGAEGVTLPGDRGFPPDCHRQARATVSARSITAVSSSTGYSPRARNSRSASVAGR
jgi:hypothetical protein